MPALNEHDRGRKHPFKFVETGWSEDFFRHSLNNDNVWRHLRYLDTGSPRLVRQGRGLIRHLKSKLQTADDELGLVKAVCTRSMKPGVYMKEHMGGLGRYACRNRERTVKNTDEAKSLFCFALIQPLLRLCAIPVIQHAVFTA